MPTITFVQSDGSSRSIDAPEGESVLKSAIANDIVGLAGECGGCVACATCKVELDEDWLARVPGREELEESLIEDEGPNVRLSCQLLMTPELDGLVVHVPITQYR